MPFEIPPRALGHVQQALDHLKLVQHYVKEDTDLARKVGDRLLLVGDLHEALVRHMSPPSLKDVAADRTPITGEGYEVVHLGRDYFRDLPEYSTSIPTGVTIGKRWKRRIPAVPNEPGWWLMGEFVAVKGRTDVADITWKRVEII